jgi:hypothetical protein
MLCVPEFKSPLKKIFSPTVARSQWDSDQHGDPCLFDSVCCPRCRPDPWLEEDSILICSRTRGHTVASPFSCWFAFPPCTSPFHFLDVTHAHMLCGSICWKSTLFFRSCYSSPRHLVLACTPAVTCAPPVIARGLIQLYSCLFDTGTNPHIASLALWVHRRFPLFPNNTDGSPLQKQK